MAITTVKIKSFNGIGDLLFVTPTLRVIKETYPYAEITVNTNFGPLLKGNPYVKRVGHINEGVFLGYPDPIHVVLPTRHHIISDWEIVTRAFGLVTPIPALRPELYDYNEIPPGLRAGIGVQVDHKGQWHGKKVWPHYPELVSRVAHEGHEIRKIPRFPDIRELVNFIAGLRVVVCTEGGVSHIAKAVGTPAVVIYGGFADPKWNGYEDDINITNVKECSYCWNPNPCTALSRNECMVEISVEMVLAAVSQSLGREIA